MPEITGVSYGINDRLIPADGLLVGLAEHFDQFLLDWQKKHPTVWRDRIPIGQFPLYNGMSQKSYIFRGTLGPQAGLTDWTAIEPSSKPSGNDLGTDACSWNPQTYTWGFDQVDFSGLQTSWRSPVFCVNDLKFQDKAQQQLAFIIRCGAQITDAVKETFNRESYLKQAAANGKFVLLAEGGGLDFLTAGSVHRVTYDPGSATTITFKSSMLDRISTLNWSQLDLIREYLANQCPDAAQGNDSGMPIFGLMLDLMDFERFVLADNSLREDFRYAKPQQLISGFNMGFKVYRGYAIMHDLRQARYSITSNDGTDVTCDRVIPMQATKDGMIGHIPEANPAYTLAELGTAVMFLSEVIQILIPSVVDSLGSGMSFGPAPDFNGNWTWLNIRDPETNPLGEVGYFFSRYQYFVKPLQYAQEAIVFLYRRCTQSLKTGCAADVSTGTAASASLASAADVTVDTTLKTIAIKLTKRLSAGVSSRVTVKKDDGSEFTAYIAEDNAAPAYLLTWNNGATNEPANTAAMNDPAVVTVTVA